MCQWMRTLCEVSLDIVCVCFKSIQNPLGIHIQNCSLESPQRVPRTGVSSQASGIRDLTGTQIFVELHILPCFQSYRQTFEGKLLYTSPLRIKWRWGRIWMESVASGRKEMIDQRLSHSHFSLVSGIRWLQHRQNILQRIGSLCRGGIGPSLTDTVVQSTWS